MHFIPALFLRLCFPSRAKILSLKKLRTGAAWLALTLMFCAVGVAQQAAAPKPAESADAANKQAADASATPQRAPETVDEAKAALKAAEAQHPGNTREVAEALNVLLQLEIEAVQANDELLNEA